MSGLRQMMPLAEVQQAALHISALIDGLWLRSGLDPASLTPEAAIRLVYDVLPGATRP